MRLVVIVPTESHKASAGVRIRYDRLRPALEEAGISMSLADLATFDVADSDCDAIMISKCYDSRSLMLAAAASERSKLVGVDLFDDYFSDETDSRLLRYRQWLARLLDIAHFALCSTGRLVDVVRGFSADLPIHQVNDPAVHVPSEQLASRLEAKLAELNRRQHLAVTWFGVGENATFPVGLVDLAANGFRLAELSRSGLDVELTVLTNRRALTSTGLAHIAGLPVRTRIVEWSEQAEEEALESSFLVFLPVNAQPFSAAKSLNRAVTALSAGCQVLSSGYPLYRSLDPLIYREVDEFLDDLAEGRLRLSSRSLDRFDATMADHASVENEARDLADFLRGLGTPKPLDPRPIGLIHGETTQREAHALVQSLGGLSVASPYCAAALDFDVVFRGSPPKLEMFVSRAAASRLLPHARKRLERAGRVGGQALHYVAGAADGAATRRRAEGEGAEPEPVGYQLATYAEAMAAIEARLADDFGPVRTIISESSKMPFVAARAGEAR